MGTWTDSVVVPWFLQRLDGAALEDIGRISDGLLETPMIEQSAAVDRSQTAGW